MKKLVVNDAWTGPDKNKHFAVGLLSAFIVGMLLNPAVGLVTGITLALCKEVYDAVSEKGTPSVQDCIATVVGSVIGYLVCEVLK